MNRIKKTLLTASFAIPMMAMGADYPWLTFKMADGNEMSVASEGLTINYIDGYLQLKSTTVDQSILCEEVKSMKFSATPVSVDGISDILSSEAEYFDLSGKNMGIFTTVDDARKDLPSGTYIVRSKDKTIKLIF